MLTNFIPTWQKTLRLQSKDNSVNVIWAQAHSLLREVDTFWLQRCVCLHEGAHDHCALICRDKQSVDISNYKLLKKKKSLKATAIEHLLVSARCEQELHPTYSVSVEALFN